MHVYTFTIKLLIVIAYYSVCYYLLFYLDHGRVAHDVFCSRNVPKIRKRTGVKLNLNALNSEINVSLSLSKKIETRNYSRCI